MLFRFLSRWQRASVCNDHAPEDTDVLIGLVQGVSWNGSCKYPAVLGQQVYFGPDRTP